MAHTAFLLGNADQDPSSLCHCFVFQVILFVSSFPAETLLPPSSPKHPALKCTPSNHLTHHPPYCDCLQTPGPLSQIPWRFNAWLTASFFLMMSCILTLFPSDFNVYVDSSSNTLAPGLDLMSTDIVLPSPLAAHSHGPGLHLSIPITTFINTNDQYPNQARLGFGHPTLPPLPPVFRFSTLGTRTSAVSSLTPMESTKIKGSYFLFTSCHLSPGLNSLLILLNSIVSALRFLWSPVSFAPAR